MRATLTSSELIQLAKRHLPIKLSSVKDYKAFFRLIHLQVKMIILSVVLR